MFVRGEWKRIWRKWELFSVVEAEKEIGDCVVGVINNFDGLGILTAELDDLWLYRNDVRSHMLAVKIKNYYNPCLNCKNRKAFAIKNNIYVQKG